VNSTHPHHACDLVDRLLDDYLAGRLPDADLARLEAHRQQCDRCARLVAVCRDATDAAGGVDDPDLVAPVMARTAGPACDAAAQGLPSLADGDVPPDTRELLLAHVATCDACSALLAALQESRVVLPTLCEIEPPPGFTSRVLAATTRAVGRHAFAEWWERLLARPRASLELAYVGTLLFVLLVGNPVAAFRGASGTANRLAAAGVERLSQAKANDGGIVARVIAIMTSLSGGAKAEFERRWEQARAIASVVGTSVESAFGWARSIDVRRVLRAAGLSIGEQKPPPARPARAAPKK